MTKMPIWRKKEDTTEHVLDFEVQLEKGKHTTGSSKINHWKLVLKIFRESPNKRKAQIKIVYKKVKIVTTKSRNNSKEKIIIVIRLKVCTTRRFVLGSIIPK